MAIKMERENLKLIGYGLQQVSWLCCHSWSRHQLMPCLVSKQRDVLPNQNRSLCRQFPSRVRSRNNTLQWTFPTHCSQHLTRCFQIRKKYVISSCLSLSWLGSVVVRALDLQSTGHGFDSWPLHSEQQPWKSRPHVSSTSEITTVWCYRNLSNLNF